MVAIGPSSVLLCGWAFFRFFCCCVCAVSFSFRLASFHLSYVRSRAGALAFCLAMCCLSIHQSHFRLPSCRFFSGVGLLHFLQICSARHVSQLPASSIRRLSRLQCLHLPLAAGLALVCLSWPAAALQTSTDKFQQPFLQERFTSATSKVSRQYMYQPIIQTL